MKTYMSVVLTLCLFAATQAQTAKVVVLSADDAAQAKRLHDELEAAQTKWKAFQERVKLTYAKRQNFEFDETFRFILPQQASGDIQWNGNGFIPTCMKTQVPVMSTTEAFQGVLCAGSTTACGSSTIKP